MNVLWYGTILTFEQLKKLVSEIAQNQDDLSSELAVRIEALQTIDFEDLDSELVASCERDLINTKKPFLNTLDVSELINKLKISNIESSTCGICCREDRGKFIIGISTNGINSRNDSCVKVRIPTTQMQKEVDNFCTKYELSQADFYFNGEECYICGH